jgi:hypothetical protein
LYLTGYKDVSDSKYYILAYVQSPLLQRPFSINFLIDTGASRTQLSWNDAHKFGRIIIRNLPPDNSNYRGIGGTVNAYVLPQTTLTFKSSVGIYNIAIGNLSVSDFETIDHRPCPFTSSMLGIDILCRFDILFKDTYVMLRI